jgi:hypothetical protein
MTTSDHARSLNRRTVLKAAGAAATLQVASPFILKARGETPLRMGMVDEVENLGKSEAMPISILIRFIYITI